MAEKHATDPASFNGSGLQEGKNYKVLPRSQNNAGSKSAIFSKMAAPRLGTILDLDKHNTRFETPAPNAYSLEDKNIETQKKIRSSANFLV